MAVFGLRAGALRSGSSRARFALRSLVACAASFNRESISRHIPLLAVEVPSNRCGSLIDEIRPHLLHMRGVKPVRDGSVQGSRLVLLDQALQHEETLPPQLRHVVEAAGGVLMLASPHASYVSGTVLEVTGGMGI